MFTLLIYTFGILAGGFITALVLSTWNKAIGWQWMLALIVGWGAAWVLGVIVAGVVNPILSDMLSGDQFRDGAVLGIVVGGAGGLLNLFIVRRALRH